MEEKRTIKIEDVRPYKNNVKLHNDKQLELLAKIVAEIGWRQSVEVNQKGVIVVGHGRYLTWKTYKDKYNLPDVWIVDDTGKTIFGKHDERPLTEQQEKMWRIADNRSNESEWINKNLKIELKELDISLLNLTGFETDIKLGEDKNDKPEVLFTEELLEEHNFIVLYFDNQIDWLNLKTLYPLKTVYALDSKDGFEKKGIGRVINGVDFINKIKGE
jgi:hypothetical protein